MVRSFGIEEMRISETVCGMGVNQKHLLSGKKKKGTGLNKERLPKCQVSMMDVKLWFLTPSSRQGCLAPALKTEMKKINIFQWGKSPAAGGLCTEWLRGSGCSKQALVPKNQSSQETESWKVSQNFSGPVGNMTSRAARCSNLSLPCTRGCRQPQPCRPGLGTCCSSPAPVQVPHSAVAHAGAGGTNKSNPGTDRTKRSRSVALGRFSLHSAGCCCHWPRSCLLACFHLIYQPRVFK